jgi:molybdopterin-guanine dinucleotide biosynthesis protein B
MKRVHIIGRKNSGKTTLITELVERLSSMHYRVGTVKHTHHHHELDTPGKDSYRHRRAGATAVGILSPGMIAAFLPTDVNDAKTGRYDALLSMFSDCDLVLVEGDSQVDRVKIEVWRAGSKQPPLADTDPSIAAIITDDTVNFDIPVWPRSDVATIAVSLLKIADMKPQGLPTPRVAARERKWTV